MPSELRKTIARNIRECRHSKFPGRGGGKRCAETFGVSPQQWSPWERGMRTPDELRLSQIANFFGVTVEYLRRDNSPPEEWDPDAPRHAVRPASGPADPAMCGLPSFRRDDAVSSGAHVAELAMVAARLLGMIGAIIKGAANGKYDIAKAIITFRCLGDLLEHRIREAETRFRALFDDDGSR